MEAKNIYKNGLAVNKVAKEYIQSLDVVVANINELAKTNAEVKAWFDSVGVSIRPKEKKNEKKDKVYLSSELIVKSWNPELTIDGKLAYKVKGELREKVRFSTFDIIKGCYRMYQEVRLEIARREKAAKQAQKESAKAETAPKATKQAA
jgi:hypothetical protein